MKLLVITPKKHDSTSFYRANGVLHDLKNKLPLEITSMDFLDIKNMTWADFVLFDVVFMQRPFTNVAVRIAEICRDLNVPVWVDYDDDLLHIPISNRAYRIFVDSNTQNCIKKVAKLANVITVTTRKLQNVFEQFNPNIYVIPNAINTRIFNYRAKNKKNTNKILFWRGTDTHNVDLYHFRNEINCNCDTFKDWDYVYFGYYPFFLSGFSYLKTIDPVLYFRKIYEMSPLAMHVPLIDNAFNRSKSNIALLEGTFAGAACLVPDWEEWWIPGTIRYNSLRDYFIQLKSILDGEYDLNALNNKAWEYIMDNLTLDRVNKGRVEILENLV